MILVRVLLMDDCCVLVGVGVGAVPGFVRGDGGGGEGGEMEGGVPGIE